MHNAESIEEVRSKLITHKNVLLVFSASWCGPCRVLAPILDMIEEELSGITFIKIDVDKISPKSFSVTSVPTLIRFTGNKEVGRKLGVQSKSDLEAWLQSDQQ